MPQSTATASTTVDLPVDHVWAVLSNHEGMSSWGPGLSVSLDQAGTDVRDGVGAVRRISGPGPMPDIVEEVVRFEPGSVLGYRAKAGVPFKNYGGEVRLAAVAEGTRIDYSISLDERVPLLEKGAAGLLARILLAGLVRASKR